MERGVECCDYPDGSAFLHAERRDHCRRSQDYGRAEAPARCAVARLQPEQQEIPRKLRNTVPVANDAGHLPQVRDAPDDGSAGHGPARIIGKLFVLPDTSVTGAGGASSVRRVHCVRRVWGSCTQRQQLID